MHVIHATNVNNALAQALRLMNKLGVAQPSRNGNVLRVPGPVATEYTFPLERVLYSPTRDANPFFHLMEGLWMLAGRDDVAFPAYFASNIRNYSDNDLTLWGAYGRRWRTWFGYDQLTVIADELRRDPTTRTRRCVLQMWDAMSNHKGLYTDQRDSDLHVAISGGKDVPCNTQAYFEVEDGRLNMTVTCRSNDIWWGCYGANAVHFSMLLEYMAWRTGYTMGHYCQFSNNWHLYTSVVPTEKMMQVALEAEATDHYTGRTRYTVSPTSMFPAAFAHCSDDWHQDLQEFFTRFDADTLADPATRFRTPFFHHTVFPMYMAYRARKIKQGSGMAYAQCILADDWRVACMQWIERRELAAQAKTKEEAAKR